MLTLLADVILLLHGAFIVFVAFGALLVLKFRKLMWVHVAAVAWGALIEFGGWICPLTPLENVLRHLGGGQEYSNGFIEHYLLPLIYPPGLTRQLQVALGIAVLVINAPIYAYLWRRHPAG